MLLSLATMIIIADLTTLLTALGSRSGEEGFIDPNNFRKAPAVVSGDIAST
jgi:hypothetical protein